MTWAITINKKIKKNEESMKISNERMKKNEEVEQTLGVTITKWKGQKKTRFYKWLM